jgi:hypothetical protein
MNSEEAPPPRVLFVFWKGAGGRALLENERGRMRTFVYFFVFL